ncbi:hypothetical protein FQA39_LY17365 [Lamprigera yunnana]|nr:hypothetical protein FQA39_LY17365 [Lamprigera yunnana]
MCLCYHNNSRNSSVDKTVVTVMLKGFWLAGMRRYVRKHIEAKRPFAGVQLDHFGPLMKTKKGNVHVLVIKDALSKGKFRKLRRRCEELNIDESSKEEESFVNVSACDASESTVPVLNIRKNAERVRKVLKRFCDFVLD